MSLYLGKKNGTAIMHLSSSQNYNDIAVASPNDTTIFHSNMELYNITAINDIPYVGGSQESWKYQAPYDIESVLNNNIDTSILVVVLIGGVWYLDVPPSMIRAPTWFQGNNPLTIDYIAQGFYLFGFWTIQPTIVRVMSITKYKHTGASSVLISKNNFIVNGINFANNILTVSSSNVMASDSAYNIGSIWLNVFNTSAQNVGWGFDRNNIYRTDSSGNKNYLVKYGTTSYSRFVQVTDFVTAYSFSTVPTVFFIIVNSKFFAVTADGQSYYQETINTGTMSIWSTSLPLNTYILCGRALYKEAPTQVTLVHVSYNYLIKFDGYTIQSYRQEWQNYTAVSTIANTDPTKCKFKVYALL